MANLILRTLTRPGDTTKSSPLTNAEVDQNFINIDADLETKAPLNGAVMTNIDINSGSIDGTSVGAASASTGRFTSVGVTDTTTSTSTTTGAVTVAGGVGVAGKINATDLQVTNTITGSVSGNAGSATQLQTARTINGTSFNGTANITTTNWGAARTISYTGDVTGSASVNGSADVSFAMTLANSGATAGTYAKVTVNAKGLVTAGSSLVAADIPSLDASKITSGTFDVARIPTGISITGNAATATTATSATNATNVRVTTSANASAFKVAFANTTANTTGDYSLLQDSEGTFTYNPSTNTLTVGTVSGALSGNATTATTLATARSINGTSFNGSADITTANWGTARDVTIGNTTKSVNGSAAVSWSLAEIGVAANVVTTDTVQTITANKTFSGRVLVSNGTANAPSIAFSADGATDTGLYWGGDGHTFFANNGVKSGEIQPGGNLVMVGNVTAYSDARLKKDLQVISDALDKVSSLTGYTYTRKDTGERQTGLVAQEVQKVLPEAVVDGEHLSLAYGNLVGLLVEAIKELRVEVNTLKGVHNGTTI